jgi:hypothetical protein
MSLVPYVCGTDLERRTVLRHFFKASHRQDSNALEEVNDTTASLIVAQLFIAGSTDPDKDIQFISQSRRFCYRGPCDIRYDAVYKGRCLRQSASARPQAWVLSYSGGR